MSMSDIIREEARLRILEALAALPGGEASLDALRAALDEKRIRQTREWLMNELSYLEGLGAIAVAPIGDAIMASIADHGMDHLEKRRFLPGVKRPPTIGGVGARLIAEQLRGK